MRICSPVGVAVEPVPVLVGVPVTVTVEEETVDDVGGEMITVLVVDAAPGRHCE